jgi:hypothetical protein
MARISPYLECGTAVSVGRQFDADKRIAVGLLDSPVSYLRGLQGLLRAHRAFAFSLPSYLPRPLGPCALIWIVRIMALFPGA